MISSCYPVYILMDDSGNIDGAFTDIDDAYKAQVYGVHTLVEASVQGMLPEVIKLVPEGGPIRSIKTYPDVTEQALKDQVFDTIKSWYAAHEENFVEAEQAKRFNEEYAAARCQLTLNDVAQGGDW